MNARAKFWCGAKSLTACLVVAALSTGCRSEPQRSAVAQVPDREDVTASTTTSARTGLPSVEVRRLWAGEYRDFYASSISPDGRYLSMVDWSTVDLAVRDLRTGALHRLTNVQRAEGKPYEDAGVSVFSRDGRKIVVGWAYSPDLQLRVLDFETDQAGVPRAGEPEVLFHNPEYEPYYPFDWSPDGRDLLAKVYTSGNANQLALISTDDGTYRPLKSFDWREPIMAEFSPDGRYVAYDFLPEVDSSNWDVFVLSVDGTHDARIVSGPALDRLLGWHPDGSLLFHSDRGGTPGVWRVPMSDGRAAGPPELLKSDVWGVEPLGFAGDDFFYGVDVNPERLYVANVDLEAGRLTGAPVAVADPSRIEIRGWDWSPDGEFLAYSGGIPGAQGSVIGIRSSEGEEVRGIHLDLRPTRRVRWDPNGESLVVFARDSKDRRGFYRIDLESGTHSTILRVDEMERPIPHRGHFALSPDGGTLYFGVRPTADDGPLDLVAYELATGEYRSLGEVGWPGRVARSPDGSRLLVLHERGSPGGGEATWVVGTLSVGGGPVTELYEIPDDVGVNGLDWTPDGRSALFFTSRTTAGAVVDVQLWSVPAEGGEPRPIVLTQHAVWSYNHLAFRSGDRVRLHPDGRQIAFMAGESRGEVWVMEGLGSTSPTAADAGGTR